MPSPMLLQQLGQIQQPIQVVGIWMYDIVLSLVYAVIRCDEIQLLLKFGAKLAILHLFPLFLHAYLSVFMYSGHKDYLRI